jgi:hypothetical protein
MYQQRIFNRMKILICACILLLASCSKYTKLDGRYFSDRQDCMDLYMEDKIGKIENGDSSIMDNLTLKQKRNKLKFKNQVYRVGAFPFARKSYRYNFKIHYQAADSFMVSPISKLAKGFFKNRDSIVFKTKYLFADQTNSFTKIIFHSSKCFGFCHDLHLELDYSRNLKVTDNGTAYDTIAVNDNYFGKISIDELERLKTILKYSQLKILNWPAHRKCFDAPDLTLIIYQNDLRYRFHMNQACLPIVSYELTGFLYRLFKHPSLKKVNTTFTYEE